MTVLDSPISGTICDLPLDLDEFEFAKPCVAQECKETATWLGLSTHGVKRCPGEAYVCDRHKEFVEGWWAERLATAPMGVRCAVCKGPVLGLVSDNLKWIRL